MDRWGFSDDVVTLVYGGYNGHVLGGLVAPIRISKHVCNVFAGRW